MSYPIYRQDFEGGTTLATACPELVDSNSAFAIDSSGAHAFTGTNSLRIVTLGTNHSIQSNTADILSGNVVVTAYVQFGTTGETTDVQARELPVGVDPTTYQRMTFTAAMGIGLVQNNAGSIATLNTTISGVTPPINTWLCCELRCNGTTISARVIRQDTGQFFVNTGAGSWSSAAPALDSSNSGTATMAAGAGSWGLRIGDATSFYVDNLFYGPAVPAVDVTSFSLTSVGATQQLTAGGFTDPLFGVTWSSSNTGVATVNSAGLVTAVSPGTCTITATGKRDAGQTATSAATVTSTSATNYTLTVPTPNSGCANNPSGNFTVSPNGTFTGSIMVTPSGGGLSTPITLSWTASSAPQTFTITPTSSGSVTLSPTNSGTLGNPSPVTYAVTAQTLSVSPSIFYASTPATATITGVGTRWTTSAPTLTVTGTAAAGTTIRSVVVLSDTSATALVSPGTTVGPMTFHDSSTAATSVASVATTPTAWSYMSSVVGFSAGLVGSVGYTVVRSDGSTYAARTTAGVFAIGSAGYAALVSLPMSGSYAILWDDGASHFALEAVNPIGVEPTSAAVPGGLNQSQCLSQILAAVSGLASGFVGTGTSNAVFLAPDGVTARITGTVDQMGNRTGLTLSPPL
jgi:hypothetical protein